MDTAVSRVISFALISLCTKQINQMWQYQGLYHAGVLSSRSLHKILVLVRLDRVYNAPDAERLNAVHITSHLLRTFCPSPWLYNMITAYHCIDSLLPSDVCRFRSLLHRLVLLKRVLSDQCVCEVRQQQGSDLLTRGLHREI